MKKVSISACEGERIGISFPFDAEILDRVKSIKGRRYHNGKEKLWSVSRATEIFRSLLKMSDELKLRGYSRKSSKTYLGHLERLGHWCREDFRKVSVDVLQGYILYLLDDALFTHSYVNQCISTIRFLSYKLLHDPERASDLPRPKKETKVPSVLSRNSIYRFVTEICNPKHRL